MKRRGMLAVAVSATVAIALSGCAFGGGAPAGDGKALEKDGGATGEITIWSWDVAATALKRLAADYEKDHEGVTIKVVDIGYDNAYDKISVGLQAGTGLPDMITLETDKNQSYITQFPKGFTDLSPVFGDDKADFDPFKWDTGTDEDGKLRMAPWDSGTVGLFYRTDYFEQAGVDPASVATWDDLVAAGETIKAKLGKTLLTADLSAGGPFSMMLQQQGQGLFNADGEITVNTPEAVETLTLLQEMQQKGLIKNAKGWDASVTSAKDGDSAVTPEAVWWIGTLEGEAPELSGKYAVRDLPVFADGGAPTSNNGGSGLAIPTQAKNPQLAADFMDFVLADDDNQASMMKEEGLFPAYLPALQSDYFQQPSEYFGGQTVFQTFADLTPQIPSITFTSDQSVAADAVSNAVAAAVLNGEDPKKVLDDAAAQIANSTGRKIAG
ncbi:sugar ABC transporter substrate-binding protein [Microbacterium bovistercoris]|uniref:Sugar ABC transporter substrate-binding protein n=1 Tax=Microbacterium bovistercoris TaxID=2293570 RepID=A0A371NTR7_9MICO|nr:sugar ABC transporter substrate-binding protein [Microbacterium bovistercoris]REJ05705.1 sugar ABC transporter substrate-binding protein [Microbacterium bovistercoris]